MICVLLVNVNIRCVIIVYVYKWKIDESTTFKRFLLFVEFYKLIIHSLLKSIKMFCDARLSRNITSIRHFYIQMMYSLVSIAIMDWNKWWTNMRFISPDIESACACPLESKRKCNQITLLTKHVQCNSIDKNQHRYT